MKAIDQIIGIGVGVVVVTIAVGVTGVWWVKAAAGMVAERAKKFIGT